MTRADSLAPVLDGAMPGRPVVVLECSKELPGAVMGRGPVIRVGDKARVFELYDLDQDPGEQRNLAADHPDTVAALRAAYDAWYDDVKATRSFEPGWIHLGSPFENPVTLCRFQDQAHATLPTHVAGPTVVLNQV